MSIRRPGWDQYFLDIARAVAARADCRRTQHGAVIVSPQRRIVSTGYNGAPAGEVGCLDGACPRGMLPKSGLPSLTGGYDDPTSPGYCISIHAEANAIAYASRSDTDGATIFITGEPCHGCRKLIKAAGIVRIVWPGASEER